MAKASTAVNSRVQDALDNHAEKISINFGSTDRDFLLCVYGAKILREAGHDPIPILLRTVRALAPAMGSIESKALPKAAAVALSIADGLNDTILDDLCIMIWWGLIPYDRDLTLDEIQAHTTVKAVIEVFSTVYAKMTSFVQDADKPKPGSKKKGDSGN